MKSKDQYEESVTGALFAWKYEKGVTGALLAWKYKKLPPNPANHGSG